MKDFEAIYRAQGRYHHTLTGFPRWWTRENYRVLSGWVEMGETVLDLACGDGGFWPFIQTAQVFGIDHAPTGLRLARQSGRSCLAQADMKAIPFRTGSFDAVACSLSLQYLAPADLKACLSEVARVLRENGRFLFSYPNVTPRSPADPAHAAVPLASLKEALGKAGFREVEIRSVSPRLPRRLYAWSTRPGLKIAAYVYYRAARAFGRDPRRAYHYAVLCESPGFGPQGCVS
jgi:SAM-dependent methyltransferase